MKVITAGQSVDAGRSRMPGGDAVAAVCCCRISLEIEIASLSSSERHVSDGVGHRFVCFCKTVDSGGQGKQGMDLRLLELITLNLGKGCIFVITWADHGVGHSPIIAGRSSD